MTTQQRNTISFILGVMLLVCNYDALAQRTQIRGFVDAGGRYTNDKFNFGLGEQDLFITSELNDDFSFLGETVFRISPNSDTPFEVSVERVIISYNYKGNHSALIGKHHTPTHYWNDTYHHGRVFFPTVDRPLMFAAQTFPIHTTGLAMNGLNLGKLKFGYNFMVGNGIGSTDVVDNDTYKSITTAVHIKPRERLQLGVSFYADHISAGAQHHGSVIGEDIKQKLYTATIAHFGSKFEFLAEGTFTTNDAQSTGALNSFATYAYTGWRLTDKLVPYLRYDFLSYDDEEIYYTNNDTSSFLLGLRYEISYLIVVKMEYQFLDTEVSGSNDIVSAQIAIGF
jgi:hypothetical protein